MNLTLQLVAFEQSKWSNLMWVDFVQYLEGLKRTKVIVPPWGNSTADALGWGSPGLLCYLTCRHWTWRLPWADSWMSLLPVAVGLCMTASPPPRSVSLESSTNTLGKQRKGWAVCWALTDQWLLGKGGLTPFKQLLKDPQPLIKMTRQYQQINIDAVI